MPPSKDIVEARDLAIRLTELMAKPAVRNDPVTKALMQGMVPKNSDFATASLAVSTLRNAGCLEQTAETTTSKPSASPGGKTKAEKQKDSKGDKKPAKKLRGFHRSIDLLIEDDFARGSYTDGTPVPEEKEDHWLAQAIRNLREDPDREIDTVIIAAEYEDGTYPNGKKFHKFKSLKTQEKEGKTTYIRDSKESGKKKVKDLSDWDLLALENAKVKAFGQSQGDLNGKPVAYDLDYLFTWANPKHSDAAARPAKNLDLSDPVKTYPSLKGTPLLETIKSRKGNADIRGELLKELSEQPWAQFGPSTTLWWPLKGTPSKAK